LFGLIKEKNPTIKEECKLHLRSAFITLLYAIMRALMRITPINKDNHIANHIAITIIGFGDHEKAVPYARLWRILTEEGKWYQPLSKTNAARAKRMIDYLDRHDNRLDLTMQNFRRVLEDLQPFIWDSSLFWYKYV